MDLLNSVAGTLNPYLIVVLWVVVHVRQVVILLAMFGFSIWGLLVNFRDTEARKFSVEMLVISLVLTLMLVWPLGIAWLASKR